MKPEVNHCVQPVFLFILLGQVYDIVWVCWNVGYGRTAGLGRTCLVGGFRSLWLCLVVHLHPCLEARTNLSSSVIFKNEYRVIEAVQKWIGRVYTYIYIYILLLLVLLVVLLVLLVVLLLLLLLLVLLVVLLVLLCIISSIIITIFIITIIIYYYY